jgi:hypothetical protein
MVLEAKARWRKLLCGKGKERERGREREGERERESVRRN